MSLLHILLVYGLIVQLAHKTTEARPKPVEVRVLDQAKKQDDVTPPPPKFTPPPPAFVPPPEIAVTPAAPTGTAIQAVTAVKAAPVPRLHPSARVEPSMDMEHSAEPDYPPISRRMNEEGIVSLLVLVGPDGSVQDVKLEQSSGSSRLDDAAIEGARTHCRFRAGAIDGKPAPLWYRYRYQFKLD